MAQVDTTDLIGSSILSATLSFDLNYSVNRNPMETPKGRITSFIADGILEYSLPNAPSDLGSIVFDSVLGANSIDITSLFKSHIDAGNFWFGMYFSPVGNSQLSSDMTLFNPDAAMLRLNIGYTTASSPVPESV